jgi:DnaJ-class molecular chaperone
MYSDIICPTCLGEGHITYNPGYPNPQTETDAICSDCHGTGLKEISNGSS